MKKIQLDPVVFWAWIILSVVILAFLWSIQVRIHAIAESLA